MKIVFIHQQTGPQFFKTCFNLLAQFSKKIENSGTPIFIIVDNTVSRVRIEGNIHIVPSDNKYREFSGWEAGLKYARNTLHINEMNLILSNDTILRHRVFDRQWFNGFLSGFKKVFNGTEPALCGDIDRIYCKPPYYSGSEVDRYASTYLCAINHLGIRKLKSFIPEEDLFPYLNAEKNEKSVLNKTSDLNNSEYWKFLESKLYIKDKSNNYPWYDFDVLRFDNYSKFQLKLLSIVIEHNISQSLIESGVKIFDIKEMVCRNYFEKFIYRLRRIKSINEFFINKEYA
jgi:hypothetical protein